MSVSPGTDLHEQLTRWVAEGLLEAGQAARIEEAEGARAQPQQAPAQPPGAAAPGTGPGSAVAPVPVPAAGPAPAPAPRRVPLVVEALGYLGGLLAVVAAFIAVAQLWPDIPTSAKLAFAAAGAVALGIVAALIVTGDEPALGRLRSVLWVLSTVCVSVFIGLLAAQVWDFSPLSTTVIASAVPMVYAAALWWRLRTPLLHLATFAYTALVVGCAVAMAWPGLHAWGAGLAVWALSAAWGAAAYRGYLAPRDAGYLAAGVGLLIGAQLTMDHAAGPVLGLATVIGLLAAGVILRRAWVLVLGALGVVIVVPQTAGRYLPQTVAAPLAVLIAGLALLGVALWLARTRRRPKSR